jgi:S1-C subfamily serine protease
LEIPGPKSLIACPRETGAECPHCAAEIVLGDPIMVCQVCGTVHHRACWKEQPRCGSYNCAPSRRAVAQAGAAEPVLMITRADLDRAVPLLAGHGPWGASTGGPVPFRDNRPPVQRGVNGLAIASFICALAGIPFFGLITGLVAILLGVLALVAIRSSAQRGLGLALGGLLLGVTDVVGWVVFLAILLSRAGPELSFAEPAPDMAVIRELEPALQRAMRANVLIERGGGLLALGGKAMGSGVILQLSGGEALIVTNRHVVDEDFPSDEAGGTDKLQRLGRLSVRMLGQPAMKGSVAWLAPGQVDLALVRATYPKPAEAQFALWEKGRPMKVGESVFAVGNPHRLGWSHTQGVISQLRTQAVLSRQVRVIQTQASINPGNSGGGLYDLEGYLLGINTWTADKRVSEGIGFAITLDTLLEFEPPPLLIRQERKATARQPAKGDRSSKL